MSDTTVKPPAPRVRRIMRALAKAIDGLDDPAVEKIAEEYDGDAFRVLIGTLLSAQTRDAVTADATARLFARPGRRAPWPGCRKRRFSR